MKQIIASKRHHTKINGKTRLVRIKTYSIDLIFDFIRSHPLNPIKGENIKKDPAYFYIDEEGNKCKLRRARIFFEIGIDCVKCDAKAKFFAIEKWPDDSVHFELYAIDNSGDDVLMTIDHMTAKSKEGPSHISNYAPMCKVCNEIKSNL